MCRFHFGPMGSHHLPPGQKVTYKTKRAIYDLRTIAEVEGAGVKAGKHAEWKEQIIVPPLPQSALTGCSLIEIDYFIQVSPRATVIGAAGTWSFYGYLLTRAKHLGL